MGVFYYLSNLSGHIPLMVRIIQFFGVLLFIMEILYLRMNKHFNRIQYISIYLLVLLFGSILSGIYQSNPLNFLIVFNILGFYGTALYFIRQDKDIIIIKISLIVSVSLFVYYFLLSMHPMQWVTHSQNHVSVVIIFISTIYYLNKINQREDSLSYIPALIALIVSIFSYGRSGIIASSIILIGLVVHQTIAKISIKNIVFTLFLFTVMAIVVDHYYFYITLALNKFYVDGMESTARIEIFQYWSREINYFPSLAFGVDLSLLKSSHSLSSHNSFLTLHSRFGISFVLIIINIFSIIMIGFKKNMFIVFLFLAILMRSFTDNILIGSGFLFGVLFFCILLMVKNLNTKRKVLYPLVQLIS
jgi:hypothetical protein